MLYIEDTLRDISLVYNVIEWKSFKDEEEYDPLLDKLLKFKERMHEFTKKSLVLNSVPTGSSILKSDDSQIQSVVENSIQSSPILSSTILTTHSCDSSYPVDSPMKLQELVIPNLSIPEDTIKSTPSDQKQDVHLEHTESVNAKHSLTSNPKKSSPLRSAAISLDSVDSKESLTETVENKIPPQSRIPLPVSQRTSITNLDNYASIDNLMGSLVSLEDETMKIPSGTEILPQLPSKYDSFLTSFIKQLHFSEKMEPFSYIQFYESDRINEKEMDPTLFIHEPLHLMLKKVFLLDLEMFLECCKHISMSDSFESSLNQPSQWVQRLTKVHLHLLPFSRILSQAGRDMGYTLDVAQALVLIKDQLRIRDGDRRSSQEPNGQEKRNLLMEWIIHSEF